MSEKAEDVEIFMPRIQKGIFYSIANVFAPFLIPLAYIIAGNYFTNQAAILTAVITAFLVVCFWASSIIGCIWEMIRYGSHFSALGLFILLITPVLWITFGVVYGVIQFQGIISKALEYLTYQ
jgi:hypothetical protein